MGAQVNRAPVDVRIEPFQPGSDHFAGAVDAFSRTWHRERSTSESFIIHQARYPDFLGLVALVDERVVAMGFGTRSEPGQWWHDRVAREVGFNHPALQNAWVLTELAVEAPFRGKGLGGRVHDALLEVQPFPRVLLSTQLDNHVSRQMYEQRGWQYLHPGMRFEAFAAPYVVMHREVRPERDRSE